jgi:hypothetical protein
MIDTHCVYSQQCNFTPARRDKCADRTGVQKVDNQGARLRRWDGGDWTGSAGLSVVRERQTSGTEPVSASQASTHPVSISTIYESLANIAEFARDVVEGHLSGFCTCG